MFESHKFDIAAKGLSLAYQANIDNNVNIRRIVQHFWISFMC
jgi:hypothetical protein